MREWQETIFSEIAEIIMGQSPEGHRCNDNKLGTPLLNGPTEFGSHYPLAVQYTSDPKKLSKKDDILFCVRGSTTGRMNWSNREYAIGRGLAAIRHKNGSELKHYLKAVIDFNLQDLLLAATGSTFPNVSRDQLANLKIKLPPLPEQHAIATVLGKLDEKIELNRRMNATLEGMARALFKSWFVDFDPVRAKMGDKQPFGMDAATAALFPSSLDDLPEGWTEVTLEKIAALNPETWGKNNRPDNIQYVDLANTKWGTIESTTHYSWKDAPSRAQRILRPGDTIIGTVRPGNGSFSFVNIDGLTGSTGFAVLRPKKPAYRELLYYIATSKDNIDRLSHLADGGAYPAVRPDVVLNTPFIFPSEEVVSAFSIQTAHMLDRVEANKQENKVLAQLRDYLLPRLISGDIRIPGAEKFVEAA
jgi:type I restriction enzyme S subunit